MPETPPHAPVTAGAVGQFFLEVAALIGIARLGWHLGDGGAMGLALAALMVAIAGAVWGIFRTRGFVPNGSDPVVAIPGFIRLALELVFFAIASWGLWVSGWQLAGIVMLLCIVLVYAATRERTIGLVRNQPPQA